MVEQRYQAVLAVIADGLDVKTAADKTGVSRQTLHSWLARYEADGPGGFGRVASAAFVSASDAGRGRGGGARVASSASVLGAAADPVRARAPALVPVGQLPSASAIYRALTRAGLVEPVRRHRRSERWKRWERAAPMELWQMDVVGGFLLADGSHAKALTGVDDHSRFCVSARLMPRRADPGGL